VAAAAGARTKLRSIVSEGRMLVLYDPCSMEEEENVPSLSSAVNSSLVCVVCRVFFRVDVLY
jgi:hypothetical protein